MPRTELPEKYIILGPDHPNDPEQAMAWNNQWGWVLPELATKYDERILTSPLPRGAQAVMNMEEDIQHIITPLPPVGLKKI